MTPVERGPAATDAGEGWSTFELVSGVPDIAKVRRWARSVLSDLLEDDLVDVLLVLSELASNVFDHARFPARLKLCRSTDLGVVGIVAEDSSPALPRLQPSNPDSARSRGLVIVEQLSARWGVVQRLMGKYVWAIVACPAVS
ncbi:ATP-binding protein [Lentzea sp. NBRC 102530]|uniref:ATP-binding protein n=1 Tax=Lentzea sp. NBRC 102530 TaxID=3032201 RepID=UPI002556ECC9|nr:ATP-binding protein [Lentzea sp. NBRC 102530]